MLTDYDDVELEPSLEQLVLNLLGDGCTRARESREPRRRGERGVVSEMASFRQSSQSADQRKGRGALTVEPDVAAGEDLLGGHRGRRTEKADGGVRRGGMELRTNEAHRRGSTSSLPDRRQPSSSHTPALTSTPSTAFQSLREHHGDGTSRTASVRIGTPQDRSRRRGVRDRGQARSLSSLIRHPSQREHVREGKHVD